MVNKLKSTAKVFIMLVILGLIAGCTTTVPESTWELSESRIIYKGESDMPRYSVIPCVVRMSDGTLVALVEPGNMGPRTPHAPIFIRSTDGGKTWSDPYKAVWPEGFPVARDKKAIPKSLSSADTVRINTIGARRDGRLMALGEKGSERDLVMGLCYSNDYGKTWTKGCSIDYSPMVAAWTWTGEQVLELDDGTLVVPVSGYFSQEEINGVGLSSGVVRSSDDGATWSLSIAGRFDPNKGIYYSEPAVAKIDDGTLVAIMRTGGSGLYRSASTDGGKTWSSPVKVLEGSHCSVVQLGDGVLLCGYHRPPQLALSTDGGKTWYEKMLWEIEKPKSNWGWYSSVEVVDDNTAIALIKQFPAHNIIRACLLHRQP